MANFIKLCVLFSVVTVAISLPQGQYAAGGGGTQQGMPYNFEWTVNDADSGNDYGHAEKSDGNVVQGQYYVLLPDGRRQIVTYTADGQSGYVADVQYEGEARFPSQGGSGGGGGYI